MFSFNKTSILLCLALTAQNSVAVPTLTCNSPASAVNTAWDQVNNISLANGTIDPSYTEQFLYVAGTGNNFPASSIVAPSSLSGTWVQTRAETNGTWFAGGAGFIGVGNQALNNGGFQYYKYTFNLDSSVKINDYYMNIGVRYDDYLIRIYVNGVQQGADYPPIFNYNGATPTPIMLDSGWIAGQNEIVFVTSIDYALNGLQVTGSTIGCATDQVSFNFTPTRVDVNQASTLNMQLTSTAPTSSDIFTIDFPNLLVIAPTPVISGIGAATCPLTAADIVVDNATHKIKVNDQTGLSATDECNIVFSVQSATAGIYKLTNFALDSRSATIIANNKTIPNPLIVGSFSVSVPAVPSTTILALLLAMLGLVAMAIVVIKPR